MQEISGMAGARVALAEEVAACKHEALDDSGLSDSHSAELQTALEAAAATAGDALKRGQQALISARTQLRHANAYAIFLRAYQWF